MSQYIIYHNPRCSKSRETLAMLNDAGIEPTIVEYLKQPPTINELADIVAKLGISVRDLIRTKEQAFKDHNLGDETLTEQQLLKAMIENPKLIERPIVIKDEKAVLCRPPENVKELF